jgi:hypothetical protein
MKRILPIALLLVCFSCLTEESADLGKASTFIRYYNGGFDDQAQAFEETDEGFVILATTQITNNNVTIQRSKIKLIKTDQYGNNVMQALYPAFSEVTNSAYYKGRGILVEKDGETVTGFTIVGDSIDSETGVSYLYILQTDADLNITRERSLSIPDVQGQAIVKDGNGDYLVLASHNNAANDMMLAKFTESNLTLEWSREYGGGESLHLTSLITDGVDPENKIYWGGTVDRGNGTDIRFITTIENSETAFDPPIGLPEFNEEIGSVSFSPVASLFNLVGTTDENGNKDILFKQISTSGNQSSSTIIGDDDPQEGNAICQTDDGGVLIIGTTGLDDAKDYYLIKLDLLGAVTWSKVFGSEKADRGVSIKQISDGSYVILGATTLGGLGSIMLRKTNSRGSIE